MSRSRRPAAPGRRRGGRMDMDSKLVLLSESGMKKDGCVDGDVGKKKGSREHRLLSFWELPEYMKDNEYIHHYYRANWPLKQAVLSIFQWHNETLNVWTHLIGFILFVGLTVANFVQAPEISDIISLITRSFPTSADTNSSHNFKRFVVGASGFAESDFVNLPLSPPGVPATRWPFLVFLAGSMFCLLSSSVCHLFGCHSHNLNLLLLRVDYTGIAVMIVASFFPPIYYIFQCTPLWQLAYLGGVTAIGAYTIATLFAPSLSTGKHRGLRAAMFCSMGLFGLIPAVHAAAVNWSNPRRNATLAYELAMAVFYLTGTGFYVSRVPERWRPGWFDLAGHSHQIFHVFVVLGALAHYGATLLFLEWRDRVGCDNT